MICDKCNQEKPEEMEIFGYHLCKDCKDDINVITIHWIMRMCEFKEPKKPATTKPFIVDWDKACALYVAGWNVKDIAGDLGVKYSSIAGSIAKKAEMYKHGMRWAKPEPKKKEDDWDDWDL